MRSSLVACLIISSAVPSMVDAQDRYPVSLGVGGGILSGGYQGMALVTVTPPRWPIGLRLDGSMMMHRYSGADDAEVTSALSASAQITLRPWRVAPYLVVGATRVGAQTFTGLADPSPVIHFPARTQLTGGLGLSFRLRRTSLFAEFRNLGRIGTPISIGLTF